MKQYGKLPQDFRGVDTSTKKDPNLMTRREVLAKGLWGALALAGVASVFKGKEKHESKESTISPEEFIEGKLNDIESSLEYIQGNAPQDPMFVDLKERTVGNIKKLEFFKEKKNQKNFAAIALEEVDELERTVAQDKIRIEAWSKSIKI